MPREFSDIDCIRLAVRIYRRASRIRPLIPSRIQRECNRLTPTERRSAQRGLELVEAALCRELIRRRNRQPAGR
jgi:hypothetical protein